MSMAKHLAGAVALIAGAALLAQLLDLVALPPAIGGFAWAAFMIAALVRFVLDWRSRKALPPLADPTPARNALTVIVATGMVAATRTIGDSGTLADYQAPGAILAATAILALAAFRFAARNRGRIGEARFESASDSD